MIYHPPLVLRLAMMAATMISGQPLNRPGPNACWIAGPEAKQHQRDAGIGDQCQNAHHAHHFSCRQRTISECRIIDALGARSQRDANV